MKRIIRKTAIYFMIMIIISAVGGCSSKTNKIQIPDVSASYVGMEYKEVYDIFSKAGFTNIHRKELEDLVSENDEKNEIVTKVSVNKTSKYEKGDLVEPDVKVIITIHSYNKVEDNKSGKTEADSIKTDINADIHDTGDTFDVEEALRERLDEDNMGFDLLFSERKQEYHMIFTYMVDFDRSYMSTFKRHFRRRSPGNISLELYTEKIDGDIENGWTDGFFLYKIEEIDGEQKVVKYKRDDGKKINAYNISKNLPSGLDEYIEKEDALTVMNDLTPQE